MPSLEQLQDVETEVEFAFGTYLRTGLNITDTFVSDSQQDLPTPRVDCSAILIEQGPHQNVIPAGTYAGRRIYDNNKVRVAINLVYAPDWVATATTPGFLRGTLRKLLTDYYGVQANLQTHALLMLAPDTLRQVDGDRTIDNERKEETITCVIEGQFFFNPAALAAIP